MPETKPQLKVFDLLPEILEIPDDDFNKLVFQWLNSPVAKECCVSKISVGKTFTDNSGQPSSQNLGYSLNVQHMRGVPESEQQYRFPMDNFLNYMINNGIREKLRAELKSRIPLIKQRDPEAYEKFVTASPEPLYIRCTNRTCGQILGTQVSLPPGESILWLNYDPITCPKCGTTFPVKPTDFFIREDWTNPGTIRGVEQILEKDPTAKLFHFRTECHNLFEDFSLVNKLNDREFEGRPAETVMYMGSNKGERGTFAHAFFLERPGSHNKFINPRTGEYEIIVNAATNEPYKPYGTADLSVLSAAKIPDQEGF